MKRKASNAAFGQRRLALAAGATMLAALPSTVTAQAAPQVPRPPTREEVERPTARAPLPPPRLDRRRRRRARALRARFARLSRHPLHADGGSVRGASRARGGAICGRPTPPISAASSRSRSSARYATAPRPSFATPAMSPRSRYRSSISPAAIVRFTMLMAKLVAIHVRGDAGRSERAIARYLEKLTARGGVQPLRRGALSAARLATCPATQVRLALRSAGAGARRGDRRRHRRARAGHRRSQRAESRLACARAVGRGSSAARFTASPGSATGPRSPLHSTPISASSRRSSSATRLRVGARGADPRRAPSLMPGRARQLADPSLDVRARTLLATAEARYPFSARQAASIWGAVGLDLIDQDVSAQRAAAHPRSPARRLRPARLRPCRPEELRPPPRLHRRRAALARRRQRSSSARASTCSARPALRRRPSPAASAPGVVPPSRLEGDATGDLAARSSAAASSGRRPRLGLSRSASAARPPASRC